MRRRSLLVQLWAEAKRMLFARETTEASQREAGENEMKEKVQAALELMVKELQWYAGKHGLGPARLQHALVVGETALRDSTAPKVAPPGTCMTHVGHSANYAAPAPQAGEPATAPMIPMQHPQGEPYIMLGRAIDLLERAKEAMECDPQADTVGEDCWIWIKQTEMWLKEAEALKTLVASLPNAGVREAPPVELRELSENGDARSVAWRP